MTVIFDLLGVQNRDHGERGIARYVASLALAIESEHPDLVDHYLVHPDLPVPGVLNSILSSGKVLRADDFTNEALSPTAGGVFVSGSVFELEQSLATVLPPWARSPCWRRVAVLYDLIPMRFASHYLVDPQLNLRYMTRAEALHSFDHLVSISQASADDAVELLAIASEKISVIGAGADTQFRPPPIEPARFARRLVESGRIRGLREGYILFPTGFDFRKNIAGLIKAYAGLAVRDRAAHQLVMMCGLNPAEQAYMGELLAEVGLSPDEVLLTGWVDDDDLVALYQGAHLVVFPSLYEGFGLPVLEARKCGAPVICGDNSSLVEVQPDSRARFNASDVAAITRALSGALNTEGELVRLRSLPTPQFSWADSANGLVAAIASLETAICPSPLPRLGLISPVPPQESGIATYTARLLEHLQHFADVTVFVSSDPSSGELPPAPPGVEIAPLNHLGPIIDGGGAFDQLVYFLGNSRFHVEALEALALHPGVVLLHDVRLTGLYAEAARLKSDFISSVGTELARMYPKRYRESLERCDLISTDDANRFGILMAADVAHLATRVLVHSPYAATLLELDTGVKAEVCYPLPAPPVDQLHHQSGDLVISSFGIVDPAKMPEVLIAAVRDLRRAYPELRLQLVGPVDPAYRQSLEMLIRQQDLTDAIDLVGHLNSVDFSRAQRSTTIAVQLRAFSNGESSAAVAELLAAGVPTVVSDLGSMSDLPDDVVVKIPNSTAGSELTRVLLELIRDQARQQALSEAAQSWARVNTFGGAAETLTRTLFA